MDRRARRHPRSGARALPLDYIRSTRNRDVRAAAEAALYTNAQLGARAAELALARAGIDRSRIGMVISGSSAPTVLCPAEAAFVAKQLGIEVPAFDLNSACTTFLAQLYHLSLMNPERVPDFVLIVQTEELTSAVDYSDRNTAVLFGDGGGGGGRLAAHPGPGARAVRERAVEPGRRGQGADPAHGLLPPGRPRRADVRDQAHAAKATSAWSRRAATTRRPRRRTLHFVGHQANLRVLEQVCAALRDSASTATTRTSSASATRAARARPPVLSMDWDKWHAGTTTWRSSVVGGGLTWARALIRFGGAA